MEPKWAPKSDYGYEGTEHRTEQRRVGWKFIISIDHHQAPRRHRLYFSSIACAAVVIVVSIQIYNLSSLERRESNYDSAMSMFAAFAKPKRDDALERKCEDAVDRLVDLNINFLAIDFDQTMIDVHTGGRWKETVPELAQHLRPLFLHLVPAATSRNIRIAVVTFSPQTKHIREVLEHAFPDIAEKIPIRGNDGTWSYEGNGMRAGKQEYMASATEELLAKPELGVTNITKYTTLLIDDDPKNIKKALKDRTRAVWINPRDPNRLLDDILSLR